MTLSEDERYGLGVALNEANLLGFEVDPEKCLAAATFNVLTLPENGPMPDDRRIQMLFQPVGKVEASLRNGRWDDVSAEIVPFVIGELLTVVGSFGGLSVYGWDFFDVVEDDRSKWTERLSLDWASGDDGLSHSITVFQDPDDRILDLRVWFDELQIRAPNGGLISLSSFIDGGKRWWDGFYNGDKRTEGEGLGMVPLK